MIKTQILDNVLMEWFTKYLLSPIAKDVAMIGVATKEKSIMNSQHLELIQYQWDTLYDIIQHDPRPFKNPRKPNLGPHANVVVGFVSHAMVSQLANQIGHISILSHPSTIGPNDQDDTVPTHTSKVNLVQSMQPKNPQQPEGKKKRNKNKNSNSKQGTTPTQKNQGGHKREK
jgi:hypothetical protein